MRILLITHLFLPNYNAGTENYTIGLAKTFSAKGHEVHVVTAEDWGRGDKYWNGVTEDLYEGILVHRIHLNWMKSGDPNQVLYDSRVVEKWLDKFLEKNLFDVVHVTSLHTLGVGILRSVKRAGLPMLLTLMDFWFLCPNSQLLRSDGSICDGRTSSWQCQSCHMAGSHLFQRVQKTPLPESVQSSMWGALAKIPMVSKERGMRGMLLNIDERKRVLAESLALPDLVLSHSAFLKEMFDMNQSAPIEVLPHGLNLDWPEKYQAKPRTDKVRIGYIGQIQYTKGVHVLTEAFQKAQIDSQANLQIWGDLKRNADYVNTLRDSLEYSQAIELKGRFEQDQIGSVMAEIDVLVVPSLWYENSPLVIKEAFAVETPIIATDLGGMAELVKHNVNGLLFEPGNTQDLARQLRRIVDETELLERLKLGITSIKTLDQEVTELELIYNDLISQYESAISN